MKSEFTFSALLPTENDEKKIWNDQIDMLNKRPKWNESTNAPGVDISEVLIPRLSRAEKRRACVIG